MAALSKKKGFTNSEIEEVLTWSDFVDSDNDSDFIPKGNGESSDTDNETDSLQTVGSVFTR